jgi:hypothetical protein
MSCFVSNIISKHIKLALILEAYKSKVSHKKPKSPHPAVNSPILLYYIIIQRLKQQIVHEKNNSFLDVIIEFNDYSVANNSYNRIIRLARKCICKMATYC